MHLKTLLIVGSVASVGVLGGACSRNVAKLSPAPSASPVAGLGRGASATVDGVRIIARAGAWRSDPSDLDTKVTPILLELQNDGSHDVLIRYNRIWLSDADGHRFNAMPPYNIEGTLTEPFTVQNPYYGFDRFAIAPYLSRYYPRFSRYGGAFAYDRGYYSPYYTTYAQVRLPTADMVQRALPEGVLSAGGRAMGFVYLEALHKDAQQVTVVVEVVDAASGATLGTARIPFVAS